MTLLSWRGSTAVVADGDRLVDVDCRRLADVVAPVPLQGCVEAITLTAGESAEHIVVTIHDRGRAMMATGFNELPYGQVAVSVEGNVLSLGVVQTVADASPDAKLTLVFERAVGTKEAT